MQRSAVRRVEARNRLPFRHSQSCGGKAGKGASLCAVSVKDVDRKLTGKQRCRAGGSNIADTRLAAHGNPVQSEGQMRLDAGKPLQRKVIARRLVGDDADLMSAGRLFGCEIQNMAEEPTHGRAKAVQYL